MNHTLVANLELVYRAIGELTGRHGVTIGCVIVTHAGPPMIVCHQARPTDRCLTRIHGCALTWIDPPADARADAAPADDVDVFEPEVPEVTDADR